MSTSTPYLEEGVGCPGARITGRCELPNMGNELRFSIRVVHATEPFLQPVVHIVAFP